MARKKKYNFVTLGDQIRQTYNLDSIAAKVAELNRINNIISQNFAELRKICHCGAIDYANDLLVLYVVNNGAFYKVNQLVPAIQDLLAVNQVYLGKLLVKVRPEKYFKPIVKPQLDPLQYAMLQKFATAINRPDLIKSVSSVEADEDSQKLEDWQIQL
jgi:hypothetical protein